jgi:hypothetical protein
MSGVYSTLSSEVNLLPVIEIAFDFALTGEEEGVVARPVWDSQALGIAITDRSINVMVMTAEGTREQIWVKEASFGDLMSHRVSITVDTASNVLRVEIDGRTVIERADLNLAISPALANLAERYPPDLLSSPAPAEDPTGLPDTVPAQPGDVAPEFSGISIDFGTGGSSAGLALRGDATLSDDGTLLLDGAGDYGIITDATPLDGLTSLAVGLDFRFEDASSVGPVRLLWSRDGIAVHATGTSLNIAVNTTDGGTQQIWIGGIDLRDAEWHRLEFIIDTEREVLTVNVDGGTVAERSVSGLALPTSLAGMTVGATPWGSALKGEIDNLRFSPPHIPDDDVVAQPGDVLSFGPGTGVADPSVSMNTDGYLKWGASSAAPFIDRMKGAFAWSGKYPTYHNDTGSVKVFKDTGVFDGTGTIKQITFADDTLLNVNKLLTIARFNEGLLDATQYNEILNHPNEYFRIEVGSSGHSELLGRLSTADDFMVIARFDRDIGMDLNAMRASGHMLLTLSDTTAGFAQLDLDENGWPLHTLTDVAGGSGEVSTIVMWYPSEAGAASDSIYSGTFYLIADGEGTVSLQQSGSSAGRVNLTNVTIDGPTVIPFEYTPDGERVTLTITSSDPNGTGEYLRNIHIVHEDHMDLFEAGEIFTPEFVALHQDDRVVRWMSAMEATHLPSFADGAFQDRPTLDYYSFNLGTNGTDVNGTPIDAIIAFSNKIGADPWINVPINASDEFVRGLAEYVEQHLDPRLKVYVELGNENWNGSFESYAYAKEQGIARWGELKLEMDSNGKFVRDGDGHLIVLQEGRFFSKQDADANGYNNLDTLAAELNLPYTLYRDNQGWSEWASMRATQVASIFEDVFETADPTHAAARLNNVMATQTSWAAASDFLMQGALWLEEEPDAWIDPASVFETLAIGAYFGATTGAKHSDLVSYWIKEYGVDHAMDLAVRQLKAGLDDTQTFLRFNKNTVDQAGHVRANQVVKDVTYDHDLIINVYDAIFYNNDAVKTKIQGAAGVKQPIEVLFGSDVHKYVRLVDGADGHTDLQLRVDPSSGTFETIVDFNSHLDVTIDEMIEDGTLFVRSLESMADSIAVRFEAQKAKADAYGLNLVAYEGGQHFAAAIWGAYRQNLYNESLLDFLADLNRSPAIIDLYDTWFKAWQEAGGASFTHYSDYGTPTRFGNWGTLEYLGQESDPAASIPKHDFLEALNESGPWWTEVRDEGTFLQGIVDYGTNSDDLLIGTAEEDILFGGDGDDIVAGGPGDDVLKGGSGTNILDGGDGNDLIVLMSMTDQIDGGEGVDTLKIGGGLPGVDLADVDAVNIEALDLRNAAQTELNLSASDISRLNDDHSLIVYAETADNIILQGLSLHDSFTAPGGSWQIFQGMDQGHAVSLTVLSDINTMPDVLLLT